MAAPIFMESRLPKSTTIPGVTPLIFAMAEPESFPSLVRTTAPAPVTVQVAENGLWLP